MSDLIPPGAEPRTIGTSAGMLSLLHAGTAGTDRAPLVLVHGGGGDASAVSWYRLMEPLSQDREIWAIDLPGFGGSIDREPVGGPSALADVVTEVIEAVCESPPVVVGVSMGGDVALNIGLDHAEAVSGVVAIAPGGLISVFRNRFTHFCAWWATRWPDWLLLPLGRLSNRFVRGAVRSMVNDPATLPPEAIEEFVRLSQHPRGALGYTRYNQASIAWNRMRNDLSGRIHALTLPTLFFHGADDPLVDPRGSRRAGERMPSAHCVIQPDCGHWAQLEAHDAFLDAVRPFLAQIDAARR